VTTPFGFGCAFVEQSGLGSLWRGGRSLSVAFGSVLRVVVAGEYRAVERSLCGAIHFFVYHFVVIAPPDVFSLRDAKGDA
jgi:hypothetical protein